jgi:hypothetical protein
MLVPNPLASPLLDSPWGTAARPTLAPWLNHGFEDLLHLLTAVRGANSPWVARRGTVISDPEPTLGDSRR